MEKYSFNHIFYWCVDFLKTLAAMLGMSYEEINVWIFCIIEPIVFCIMAVWIIWLIFIVRKFKKKSNSLNLAGCDPSPF
jgi:hypothetical protein